MASTEFQKLDYVALADDNSEIIQIGSSIGQAIRQLQDSRFKVCFVLHEDFTLAGSITDGDIRRALLRGASLTTPVDKAMNPMPMVVGEKEHISSTLINTMSVQKVSAVPKITAKGGIAGIYVLDCVDTNTKIENEILIMAGGFGRRLRPYTETIPKPMVKIHGKPMLQHIIEKAAAEGFFNFTISLFYLGEIIQDFFGDGAKFGVNIKYVKENEPLGTGGALQLLEPRPKKPFIVTNGDVMSEVSFRAILRYHVHSGAVATMGVKENKITNPYGVVQVHDGAIIGFEEKPTYTSLINAGVYALNPEFVLQVGGGEKVGLPTLFERCLDRDLPTSAFLIHEIWSDVGRPDDLRSIDSTYQR